MEVDQNIDQRPIIEENQSNTDGEESNPEGDNDESSADESETNRPGT